PRPVGAPESRLVADGRLIRFSLLEVAWRGATLIRLDQAAAAPAFGVCSATAASARTLENTGVSGGGASVSLYPPSPALTPVVVKTADFDAVGEVFGFAGGVAPPGMRVAQNALFTKVGTT
ncbi:MAG: hypothetical protein AAFU61_03810, partial [Pseudomonadota bacterium]